MPARGVIYFDEIDILTSTQRNVAGVVYSANLIYGKGLVKAHFKADDLSWAGCVIDKTILREPGRHGVNMEEFLSPFPKLHSVPYKHRPADLTHEYARHIIEGELNERSFANYGGNIRRTFAAKKIKLRRPSLVLCFVPF